MGQDYGFGFGDSVPWNPPLLSHVSQNVYFICYLTCAQCDL